MRRLHVVGFSADHQGFILATRKGAKSGGFVLALDDALIAEWERARQEERAAGQGQMPGIERRSGSQSGLTPREIQARLRSGRTVEEVAAEAGVGTEWVERFAAPVLAEQAAAVDRASRAVLHTPRKGPSDRTLEASVLRNLADRGVSMTDDEMQNAWAARQLMDSDWLISFTFRSRGRVMTAEWMLNHANGALTARNRLGGELGYVDLGPDGAAEPEPVAVARPGRQRAVSTPKVAVERPVAAPKVAVERPVVAAKVAVERPVAAQKVAADRPGADKPDSRPVPAKAPVKTASAPRAAPAAKDGAPPRKAAPVSTAAPDEPRISPTPRAAPSNAPAPAAGPKTKPDGATTETARRVAAAPRNTPVRTVPVPPAAPPRPAGAHFVRETAELPVVPAAPAPRPARPRPKPEPEPEPQMQLALGPLTSAPPAARRDGPPPSRTNRPLRAERITRAAVPPEPATGPDRSKREARPRPETIRFGEEE